MRILFGLAFTLAAFAQQPDWVKQIRNKPFVDARVYGVKCDGNTSDTSAIQAAITAATSTGGSVLLPAGNCLTGAISLANGVTLAGSSMTGTALLANANSVTLITLSAVSNSGISKLTLNGNGKTGVTGIDLNTYPSVNNRFYDLLITGVANGIEIVDAYFSSFDNVRISNPTVSGVVCGVACNATSFNNLSIINAASSLVTGFDLHNGGAISITASTFEGYLQNKIYQEGGVSISGSYFENTGTPNHTYWIEIGNAVGAATSGVSITGTTFNEGAAYGLLISAVDGLNVAGNTFSADTAAFRYDNSSTAGLNIHRQINIGNNDYNIGGAGYDSTKIFAWIGAYVNDSNNAANQEIINPLLLNPTREPSDASLANGQGVVYVDETYTNLWYKYKSTGGTIYNWMVAGNGQTTTPGIYYNPAAIIDDHSLIYQLSGVDGAILRGYGGVRLANGSSAAGTCLGQFGGYDAGIKAYFGTIGLGPDNCLPPTASTVNINNKSTGSSTLLTIQTGDTQAANPLTQWLDKPGTGVLASVNTLGQMQTGTVAFSALGAPTKGTSVYCSDCTIGAVCTGSGSGSWAFRTVGNVWTCPW